jgi:hypothetical protein
MHHQTTDAKATAVKPLSLKSVLWAVLAWSIALCASLASQAVHADQASACNLQSSQQVFGQLPQGAKGNSSYVAAINNYTDNVLLPHLQARLPACQNNVEWLVLAGQTLMAAQQHLLASDYLERAIMLAPEQQGAKLDYALALAGSEQPDAALSLLSGLQKEPDMPAHLRASIQALFAKLQAAESKAAQAAQKDSQRASHKFYAGLKAGRDSNLLGAPNLSELSLNFSGIPFNLPLDSSYLSQAGNYTRADLGWNYVAPTEGGHMWQAWAQARDRSSPASADAMLRQGSVGAEFKSSPLVTKALNGNTNLQAGLFATAQGIALQGGSGVRYNAKTISLGVHSNFSLGNPYASNSNASKPNGSIIKCEAKLGPEWQQRDLISNPLLSGRYTGAAFQWVCQPSADTVLIASLSSGRDTPNDPSRAGGQQNENGARLMAKHGPVQMELEADYKRDSTVYSVLLSERPRKIARVGGRLEWQGELKLEGNEYQMQAGYQWSLQKSNLHLFRQQNHGPYVGISKAW